MISVTFINRSTGARIDISVTVDTLDWQATYTKKFNQGVICKIPCKLHHALEQLAKETKYYYFDGWIPVLTTE